MEATPSRPGRKKRRMPGEWAQNRRKILRNTGAEYVGVSRKVVQARKSGVDCKCSMECFECVDEQSRQLVFDKFWLSPITTYRMLTCLDRWNPKSLRDGIATGKVWQVSRDEPGRGSTMLWLLGPE